MDRADRLGKAKTRHPPGALPDSRVPRPLFFLVVALLAAAPLLARADSTPPAAPDPASPANVAPRPSLTDGIILGLVEGVTEFLPISSTGHLVIANHVLGLDSSAPVGIDKKGRTVTLKDAADTYAVVIQVGAIAAVALLYWGQIATVFAGLAGRDPAGLRLLRNLVLACVPPVVTALLFKKFIKAHLFSVHTVAWALLVGAGIMLFTEYRRRRTNPARLGSATSPGLTPSPGAELTGSDLSPFAALLVGFGQCLALWPGMSRSMTAMVSCYFVGLKPARAAEFSFLLGLPLLGAAAAKDALDGGPAMVAAFGWVNLLVGLVVAFISAALAVKLFVGLLTRLGLVPFAIYRILLGVALLGFFAT